MNRREFVKALAGISLLGLLVKVPKVDDDQWRETLVETTRCAYMTKESAVVDPPVVAGDFIDIYSETACYSFVEPRFIIGDADGATDGVLNALRSSGLVI